MFAAVHESGYGTRQIADAQKFGGFRSEADIEPNL